MLNKLPQTSIYFFVSLFCGTKDGAYVLPHARPALPSGLYSQPHFCFIKRRVIFLWRCDPWEALVDGHKPMYIKETLSGLSGF